MDMLILHRPLVDTTVHLSSQLFHKIASKQVRRQYSSKSRAVGSLGDGLS